MPTQNVIIIVVLLAASALVLNLPFGYLRVNTKKFSVMWFLYIHLPIPFIYVLRTMAGMSYRVIPFIVAGAVAGQFIGGRINKARNAQNA
ncbi:MAG: hypothetical protein HY894_03875 [Deltaproteobacteria bacterium]|nr:hypothetical protein [Deltaproteobacteria bacterium]